ncbi:MAG: hypothetical protein RLZZ393_698 [Pseudomonadota bacterium]|jgi:hypothetical protein
MKTPVLAAIAFAVLSTAAGATEPPQAGTPTNPHKARDARFRECTERADAQQLAGDARRIAIAQCMRAPQAPQNPR